MRGNYAIRVRLSTSLPSTYRLAPSFIFLGPLFCTCVRVCALVPAGRSVGWLASDLARLSLAGLDSPRGASRERPCFRAAFLTCRLARTDHPGLETTREDNEPGSQNASRRALVREVTVLYIVPLFLNVPSPELSEAMILEVRSKERIKLRPR